MEKCFCVELRTATLIVAIITILFGIGGLVYEPVQAIRNEVDASLFLLIVYGEILAFLSINFWSQFQIFFFWIFKRNQHTITSLINLL